MPIYFDAKYFKYLVFIFVLFMSMVIGGYIAIASVDAAIAIIGFSCLVFVWLVPIHWLFWILGGAAFLVSGPFQYFLHVQKSFWLPFFIGLILLLRLFILYLGGTLRFYSLSLSGFFGLLFFTTLIFSSAVGFTSPLVLFFGTKEYLFLSAILLAFSCGVFRPNMLRSFWQLLPYLAVMQIPAIIYQYFIIVPRRIDDSRWDAIVGLFGGDPLGGGASGAMVLFVIFSALFVISMRREKIISFRKTLIFLLCAAVVVAMTEVKFALFIAPLGLILIFRSELLTHPLKGIGVLAGAIAFFVSIMFFYQSQFTDSRTAEGKSIDQYMTTTVNRQSDTEINMLTGEMGRSYALQFWLEENKISDPFHFFIGHGMGSSRSGAVMGAAAKKYPFNLQRSTAAIVLWEGGVFSLLFLVLSIITLAISAIKLVKIEKDPLNRALLNTTFAGLIINLIGIFYNTDLHGVAPSQFVFLLMVATVMLCKNKVLK